MTQRPPFQPGPILRHAAALPVTSGPIPADDARIRAHLDRVHGGARFVFHEIVSERVHVDVHVCSPTATWPLHLLVTSGMSALPMRVPPACPNPEDYAYLELCMLLPPEWSPNPEHWRDERIYWPVRLLKTLARVPHAYGTWLWSGHSVPNGDPAVPYVPGTLLSGAVIVPPFLLGEAMLDVPGAPPLHVYQVVPVTTAEMDIKLRFGFETLLDRLETVDPQIFGPVNPYRASVV